ncbi:acetoacetate decarboxylase [Pseudoalteromonas ulvae]|uniref:Acetoacetate decarboxylase n=1 Tax=Pseudoalteromonas ulvae TaxID=107327 RepID=A0A244CVJ0_PSEDV|nr:acetoacetate decarboxylase [Pseudoalteromonas ulvae]OUL59642.1 acetoacetate decarboxylase [Pseudoalteromonas ulvae]
MSESTRPPYVHFPGSVIAQLPCRMLNANMYGFFVKGELARIQAYLDMTLNTTATDAMRFKALSEYTLLTFTDIENIAAKNPPYRDQGWMQETDIIIWLPVAKMVNKRGKEKVDHIYWYPAFICVNNIYALINGRETWGYNKYLCQYQMPNIGDPANYFSLSVDAFQPFTLETKMAEHHLLEVKKIAEGSENLIVEFVDLVKEVIELLKSEHDFFDLDWNALKQLLDGFINPQMDQILFKQFPDGEAKQAVYQAVMHSPSIIKKVHKAAILTHEYQVTLHQVDTFPLDQMFGLTLGQQDAILPFTVLMDFDQEPAFEIATNPAC